MNQWHRVYDECVARLHRERESWWHRLDGVSLDSTFFLLLLLSVRWRRCRLYSPENCLMAAAAAASSWWRRLLPPLGLNEIVSVCRDACDGKSFFCVICVRPWIIFDSSRFFVLNFCWLVLCCLLFQQLFHSPNSVSLIKWRWTETLWMIHTYGFVSLAVTHAHQCSFRSCGAAAGGGWGVVCIPVAGSQSRSLFLYAWNSVVLNYRRLFRVSRIPFRFYSFSTPPKRHYSFAMAYTSSWKCFITKCWKTKFSAFVYFAYATGVVYTTITTRTTVTTKAKT